MVNKENQLPSADSKNELETYQNVEATCNECGWKDTGAVIVNKNTGYIEQNSELLKKCILHHIQNKSGKKFIDDHHSFELKHEGQKSGHIAAASMSSIGDFHKPGPNDKTIEEFIESGEWNAYMKDQKK